MKQISFSLVARRYTGLVTAVILLALIVGLRRLQARPDRGFEPRPPTDVLKNVPIRFEEVAARLGLDYHHELYFPNPQAGSYLPLMAFPPSISVADFDGDGFMDIYVVQPKPGLPNRLFRNRHGERFEDIAAAVGLDDVRKPDADSMAVWADFNRDGRPDLFLSRFGCHTLFLQDPSGGHFTERPDLLDRYCSNPKAVNLLDYDGDGWIDVVFGNYYPETDLATYLPLNHVFGYAGEHTGGTPKILFGGPTGLRYPPGDELRELESIHAHTTAVGVSDIDGDGHPDLFFANDYTYDMLLMNRGQHLADATEKYLPRSKHGFGGMNSDFADFDGDGTLGLYVSELYVPPFSTTKNLMWKRSGQRFDEVGDERGAARCGWSWSAKFGDFDDDGNLDLFVVNGKARGSAVKTPEDPQRSFMFARNTIATLPFEVRWNLDLYPDFSHFQQSAFERSCVFWNRGDAGFADVAPEAGVNDLEEGQSAALIDYDNDGRIDVVVGNLGGPLMLYHNVSPHPGHWVGLELVGADGSKLPLGTRTWLSLPDGRRPTRELYPANGYRGQSDPRIIYGLGKLDAVPELEVRWPDGRDELFRGLRIDTYQPVIYGHGAKP